MAAMPFLCRGVLFLPKLSYHRNVSLAVYLPIFCLSFYRKTKFYLYKLFRLSLLLFPFSVDFSVDLVSKYLATIFETASNDMAQIDPTFVVFLNNKIK